MADRFFILGAAALVSSANSVWAHPGHGTTAVDTAAHYITDPFHGTVALLVVFAAAMLGRATLKGFGREPTRRRIAHGRRD